jgi:asparagine synthase (glutamine-hydrolysing)
MCGIAGLLLSPGKLTAAALGATIAAMTDTLTHRGPDDGGVWLDAEAGIALGHRRLAIIDLSAAGHQPMLSAAGRFVLTFNGEIYNFVALRRELTAAGHGFHGDSDTEVLLAALATWGIDATLRRIEGMFAFALWDREARQLTLARDRSGEKPLYYGWHNGALLFASELKAFSAFPGFAAAVDREALAAYVELGWVPVPASILAGIRKLPPASVITLSWPANDPLPEPQHYWSAAGAAQRLVAAPFRGSMADAADLVEQRLRAAVQSMMVADVPLGALLSGGIDSSLVVALMQASSPRPVRTFSIGFAEQRFNEAPFAKAVAQHLGTEHHELIVTAKDCLAIIPRLPAIYDEPLADTSQVPTVILASLTRRTVTVALSGDGGDELFGGYSAYALAHYGRRLRTALPRLARRAALRALAAATAFPGAAAADRWGLWRWQAGLQQRDSGRAVHRFAQRRQHEIRAADLVIGATRHAPALGFDGDPAAFGHPAQAMMYLDFTGFMTDDILAKVDRASMAVALEVRCPFLDHGLIELAWSLPMPMRLAARGGKRVLLAVLDRYLPRHLFDRPKAGFDVPLQTWLRGPLRDWADALLDERRLADEGYFHPQAVRRLWQEHLSRQHNHKQALWSVLMFQSWLDHRRG